MATITLTDGSNFGGPLRRDLPWWECVGIVADFSIDMSGTLSGTVLDTSGAPLAGTVVRVYHRTTGVLIASVRTDSAGAWTWTAARVGVSDYLAVAIPPDSVSGCNALVYDHLVPV